MKSLKSNLFVLQNEDNIFHEEIDTTNLCNFPHPFRLICRGQPNCGKTNVIYNILYHKKPPFERILIFHNDNYSCEYQNVDAECIDELPDIDEIDSEIKNILIIEDIDYKNLPKQQGSLLDRYFGCFSTHHGFFNIIAFKLFFKYLKVIFRYISFYKFAY